MLIALILLLSDQSALNFRAYVDGGFVRISVAKGKVVMSKLKQPLVSDQGYSLSTSSYVANVASKDPFQKIDIYRNSGRVSSIERKPDPTGWSTIMGDQRGRYIFDVNVAKFDGNVAGPPKRQSRVYRVNETNVEYVCTVPGYALDVIEGRVLSAQSQETIEFYSLSNPPRVDNSFLTAKQIKRVYARRDTQLKSDKFRKDTMFGLPLEQNVHRDELAISPDGKHWFEATFRIFVLEGKHQQEKYFGGDVILSAKGVAWQWKKNNSGVMGAYFVDSHTFRIFRSGKFLMGSTSLKWYSAGIYDIDLITKKVKKVDPKPLTVAALIDKSFWLHP